MPGKITIASCSVEHYFKTDETEQCLRLIEEAGKHKADIVCIPEYCASPFKDGVPAPVPVPGAITDRYAALAKKYRMYVIAPLVEKLDGPKHYNSAILFDRQGQIAGVYRKTHLCTPEYGEGDSFLPGNEVPVFKTDFGTIGITICMDIHYPELYSAMALKGAEIIFWPSGALDYTGDLIESIVNARAIDYQIWMVPSHHIQLPYLAGRCYGRSRIIDPMGRIRADTGHFPGVAIAPVDLDQQYPLWYEGPQKACYPTMRDIVKKTRRPELYGDVARKP